jgi:hypothetical protein
VLIVQSLRRADSEGYAYPPAAGLRTLEGVRVPLEDRTFAIEGGTRTPREAGDRSSEGYAYPSERNMSAIQGVRVPPRSA